MRRRVLLQCFVCSAISHVRSRLFFPFFGNAANCSSARRSAEICQAEESTSVVKSTAVVRPVPQNPQDDDDRRKISEEMSEQRHKMTCDQEPFPPRIIQSPPSSSVVCILCNNQIVTLSKANSNSSSPNGSSSNGHFSVKHSLSSGGGWIHRDWSMSNRRWRCRSCILAFWHLHWHAPHPAQY